MREISIKNEGELTKMREVLRKCKSQPFLHCFLSLAIYSMFIKDEMQKEDPTF